MLKKHNTPVAHAFGAMGDVVFSQLGEWHVSRCRPQLTSRLRARFTAMFDCMGALSTKRNAEPTKLGELNSGRVCNGGKRHAHVDALAHSPQLRLRNVNNISHGYCLPRHCKTTRKPLPDEFGFGADLKLNSCEDGQLFCSCRRFLGVEL